MILVSAVVLLACLAVPGGTPAEDPPLALLGARVIGAPGAEPLEGATVLVRGGRIEAVGVDLALPFDARAVDLRGMTLTPALVDALSEPDLEFPRRTDQQGRPVDDGRDVLPSMFEAERAGLAPEREAWRVLPQDAAARKADREVGFGALVVAPAGQLLAGTGAWLALSGRPPREAVVRTTTAHYGSLAWRTGPENYEGNRYPATLMGVMAHLRQVLLDAERELALLEREHGEGTRRPADAVLDAIVPILQGDVPLVLRADEEEDIRLALGVADMFPGIRLVIAGGREAWRLADELAARAVPVIHTLDFGDEPEDPDAEEEQEGSKKRGGARGKGAGSDVAEDVAEDLAEELALDEPDAAVPDAEVPDPRAVWNPKKPTRLRRDVHDRWLDDVRGPALLVEAGVVVASGSSGRSAKDLLESLTVAREKGGLSEEAALAMLTRDAYAVYGLDSADAELRAGAPAFLTAWSDAPLGEESEVRALVVDGMLFDLRTPNDLAAEPDAEEDEQETDAETDADESDGLDDASGTDGPDADVLEWPVELDADREPALRTGGNVLVRGATILTASHGTLSDTDMLVCDGRIVELGVGLQVPDGVHVVEAAGMFLIPGIIDCHSHTAIRGGINEWTRVVTPEVSIEDEVDPDDVNIYRALAGGVTSARLLHGSANAIGGRHEVIKMRWGKTAPEMVFEGAPRGVKFALGENPRQSNYGGGGRFPRTRMGVEAVLRRSFEAARDYADEWALHESRVDAGESPIPPRRDLRLEALSGILDGSIQVHSHCYQADEMLMLIRIAEDYGFRVATLQHVLEGYKVAAEIAAHGAGGSTFVDWWGYKFEAYDATPYCAALMNEAGVLMSVNSDSDEHLRRLYLEAAKTVKYGGVADEEALRMVTLNPAIQLGIDERVGSIDVGKDADFALFSRHPFDVGTQCLMTFVDGELYFERDDSAWTDWDQRLAATLAEKSAAREGTVADDEAAEGAEAASDAANAALLEERAFGVSPEALGALPLPRAATRAASTPARPAAAAVALVGGAVHTMERDDQGLVVHDPGVVLMRDGRIVGVYAGRDPPPEDYAVRDVSGSHVWPGLIDAGCSVGLVEIDAVAGSADRREIGRDQPDLRAAAGWHADSEHIPVTRANGTTCALVVPAGGRVLGQSSAMALEGWTANDALIRDAVALHVRAPRTSREPRDEDEADEGPGDGHVCDMAGGPPPKDRTKKKDSKHDEKLIERVDESWADLRRMFEDAREYVRIAGEARSRGVPGPDPDPRLTALAPYALGTLPVVFEADGAGQIMDALRFAEEQRLHAVIAGGRDAWKVADEIALAGVPVIVGPVLRLPGAREDPYDATYHNAAVLARAGVPIAFRTNDSASARDLPFHAGMAMAFGLDEDAALEALTAGAARILGLEGEIGTLAPGVRADVIVTDGSPLQIRTQVQAAYIGGRAASLETRHTRLYDRYRARLHEPGLPSR
ncbi:MAG: amidohydrolase family protein [Planctomycetota bacterium]|jgi:imidazolonepropionase-like amidohydrolase